MSQKFGNCVTCGGSGEHFESPAGAWWSHFTHPADGHDFVEDIHGFYGIVTKLRTTRGSLFALDVMAEAADLIESQAAIIKAFMEARK